MYIDAFQKQVYNSPPLVSPLPWLAWLSVVLSERDADIARAESRALQPVARQTGPGTEARPAPAVDEERVVGGGTDSHLGKYIALQPQ